jgi:iron complex outermembrane receptor protein
MNNALLKAMLCMMSALGLLRAAPVLAQAAAADQGTSAKQATPAASVGAGNELAEIIVTARRVEERAQDVPISMTVFNQQQLTNRNVVNAQDLATYTPSLSANSNFGSQNSSFAIRGFVQDIGTQPSVGVYFADVVSHAVPRTTCQSVMAPGPASSSIYRTCRCSRGRRARCSAGTPPAGRS